MDVRNAIGDADYVLNEPKRGKKPRISIVTPTYCRNAEGLLGDCLQSALDQSFTDFEHIIIDDGSSDGTEQTVTEFAKRDSRIVYVRHDRNSGLPAVRTNEGIMRARGEAIAFLFDDNVFEPDFLKHALAHLDETKVDLVHGEVAMPVESGNDFVLGGWPASVDLMRSLNTVANGGILVRRDFFDHFGLYDPHVAARRLCDWELWCRSLWLGAKFSHLPETVATEKGLISPNSLGNSVSVDWKSVYGYLQDVRAYEERAVRFSPENILDESVLDARVVHQYVRDEDEWKTVVDQVYTPFVERSGIDFDPMLLSNRAASIDPAQGWNASWSIEQRRRRVLFVTNCVPSFVSTMMDSVRMLPGAIVLNCPEWQFSAFEAGTFDTIYLVDSANPGLVPFVDQHKQQGTSIIYLSLYGDFESEVLQQNLVPAYAKHPHVAQLFGGATPYFPQPGIPHDETQKHVAATLCQLADIVIGPAKVEGAIALPDLPLPSLSRKPSKGETILQYKREDTGTNAGEAKMLVARGKNKRRSSSSLTSMLTSNSDCEIRIEKEVLDALPTAERLGLGRLAERHNISLRAIGDRSKPQDNPVERELACRQWMDWLGSLERLAILRQRLSVTGNRPLMIDIFLMSELYSGSEAYGLILAKNLHELGVTVRVRVPEKSVYGGDDIAVNDWLRDNDVPLATRFPHAPGEAFTLHDEAEQSRIFARLNNAIAQEPSDLIISSGYIPMLTRAQRAAPMFMAVFSAAAYDQRQLLKLRGGIEGLMSDSSWALTPTERVVRAPSAIIRSAVFGLGGGEAQRVVAASKKAKQTIRIAVTGTLQIRKRQLEAVQATRMLIDRGYDVELHLYGYELEMLCEYLDTLDTEIAALDLGQKVIRHGFVEDGREITQDNHVILSASTDESLPQGLMFQMYEGLVGVAVLCGGIDEILIDGETGYLTADPTPDSIADTLARALDDRKNWAYVTARARRKIFDECSAPRMTNRLLDLMNDGVTLDARGETIARPATTVSAETVPAAVAGPTSTPPLALDQTQPAPVRKPVPVHSKAFTTTLVLSTDIAGLSGVDIATPHALIHDAELCLRSRPGQPVCTVEIGNTGTGKARLRWSPMKGAGERSLTLRLTASTYMPDHDRGIVGERNIYRAVRARKIQLERVVRNEPAV